MPVCAEQFFTDTHTQLGYAYDMGEANCSSLENFESEMKHEIARGVETIAACENRCYITYVGLECIQLENNASRIQVSSIKLMSKVHQMKHGIMVC